MTEFIASNGYQIQLSGGAGYVRNVAGHERHALGRYSIEALREYFQHEASKKPWEDAKPGEAWVFTIDGQEFAGVLDMDREFIRLGDGDRWTHVNDADITAGRRIWPEEVAS